MDHIQPVEGLEFGDKTDYYFEHLCTDDLSFIFSLKFAACWYCLRQYEVVAEEILLVYDQVANNATLYGVCLHVQEIVQIPPSILGVASPVSKSSGGLSHCVVSAPRCYCVLTRVPFFELHYEMLNRLALIFRNSVDYCKIHMPCLSLKV
ncbi:hypothetical protein U1Q18_033935 [Sarracenia purpurea var. burkii]